MLGQDFQQRIVDISPEMNLLFKSEHFGDDTHKAIEWFWRVQRKSFQVHTIIGWSIPYHSVKYIKIAMTANLGKYDYFDKNALHRCTFFFHS